jgi:cytochrome c oxidase assembly protein subunit 11
METRGQHGSEEISGPWANRSLVARLGILAIAMFGFGFLMVPIYSVLCQITGIGGRTASSAENLTDIQSDQDRLVTVEFVAVLNEQAPWEFRPALASMQVHPGQLYDTSFFARNLTDTQLVGQAVPSIAPGTAAKHFRKTECFCFTQQHFAAKEGRDMGLQFMVDPDLPDYVDRVTLSYTFFVVRPVAGASSVRQPNI